MSDRQELALFMGSAVLFIACMLWLGTSDSRRNAQRCTSDLSLLHSAQDSITYLRNHKEC